MPDAYLVLSYLIATLVMLCFMMPNIWRPVQKSVKVKWKNNFFPNWFLIYFQLAFVFKLLYWGNVNFRSFSHTHKKRSNHKNIFATLFPKLIANHKGTSQTSNSYSLPQIPRETSKMQSRNILQHFSQNSQPSTKQISPTSNSWGKSPKTNMNLHFATLPR